MSQPLLHVALIEPEIGPNAGNIGRLCLGIQAHLHLVHPLGFSTDDKAVRRAGLDYWKHVNVTEHAHSTDFFEWAGDRDIHLFSTKAGKPYTQCVFKQGSVLVFGRESAGLSGALLSSYPSWRIPMPGPVRSLNLANAAAVACMEALRQISPEHF